MSKPPDEQTPQAASDAMSKDLSSRCAHLEARCAELEATVQSQRGIIQRAEKMAALGELMAGVAHEVKTPLGALKSNSDLFHRAFAKINKYLSDAGVSPEQLEAPGLVRVFTTIERLNTVNSEAVERMQGLIDSLRRFARVDQKTPEATDVHEQLRTSLSLVAHKMRGRIEIHEDFGELPLVAAVPNQLSQVFLNLLVNASQAIEDTGEITIETRVVDAPADDEAGKREVVIGIRDSGKGIALELQPRIFELGFTTKDSAMGTGLGLAIANDIIRAHGGRLSFESEPGQGATFRVHLPIDPDALRGQTAAADEPGGEAD